MKLIYKIIVMWNLIVGKIQFFLYKIVIPKSENDDSRRREFILNIVLLSSIALAFISFISVEINNLLLGIDYGDRGISSFFAFFILIFFIYLYILSRTGKYLFSSFLFVLFYLIVIALMAREWGADLPVVLLFSLLIVIMTGILMGSAFGFIAMTVVSVVLIIFAKLQILAIVIPNNYWRNEIIGMDDFVAYAAIFFIASVISWLSNRETEKSLQRARKSEAELKNERDNLEITVEERTKELKKVQMEKMSQLYRFAEFGKLSSGLFHDLVNPLTAVTLSLEQARLDEGNKISDAKSHLEKAVQATKKIESFITTVRKQIQKQETSSFFSLTEEVIQSAQMFSYKARKANVELKPTSLKKIKTFGDQIKFSQIISNLISNAIDSYESVDNNSKNRRVEIKLWKEDDNAFLSVQDWGVGISEEDLNRIFEPFFTTKAIEKGTGIGLSSTKDIIEKGFRGKIDVYSKFGEGTIFKVWFPLRSLNKKI